jgi:hypothetical protein
MTTPSSPPSATPTARQRMPFWAGILGLILLVPAIGIPIMLNIIREPAFQSLDEVQAENVKSMEIFILQRPDGGDDIGGTRGMFQVPPEHFQTVLQGLRNAQPMEASLPRGIWLGRMIVKFQDGRRQTVMFHRPRTDSGPQRVEIRIGSKQFLGGEVNVLTKLLDGVAGREVGS